MKLIFNDNKLKGFSRLSYNSNPISIVKQKSEQELTDLLSDILEEDENWQDKYRYLSLDENEEVYLDEQRYEEEQDEE